MCANQTAHKIICTYFKLVMFGMLPELSIYSTQVKSATPTTSCSSNVSFETSVFVG